MDSFQKHRRIYICFLPGALLRTESPGQARGIWRLSCCNLRFLLRYQDHHQDPWILPDSCFFLRDCVWLFNFATKTVHKFLVFQSLTFLLISKKTWSECIQRSDMIDVLVSSPKNPSSRAASRLASPAPSPAPAMASPGRGVCERLQWWGWEVSLGSQLINSSNLYHRGHLGFHCASTQNTKKHHWGSVSRLSASWMNEWRFGMNIYEFLWSLLLSNWFRICWK